MVVYVHTCAEYKRRSSEARPTGGSEGMVGVLWGGLRAQIPVGARAGAPLAPVVLVGVGVSRARLISVGKARRGGGQRPRAPAPAAAP